MKKNSPQKSRRTSDHIPLVEPDQDPIIEANPDPIEADLERLSLILPVELRKELFNESVKKSLLIYLSGIGKGWAAPHKAFAKCGIDFTDIGLRLVETGMKFIILRHFRESVETYVKPFQKSGAPYRRAASLLTKPEAPFSPFIKDAIRQEAEHLTVLPQLKTSAPQELDRYFRIPEGTKSLDPDTQKSLHKQPMFVKLRNDLFALLQEKGTSKYRAARLLYDLWLSAGIIRTSDDYDFSSFNRDLKRHPKSRPNR